MSQQITTQFVQQFSTNVQLLLQQKGSRLRGTIREGMHVGEQASPVDQIGSVAAIKRTTRYPDLTPMDTPADRRWVFPSDYDWNDMIDNIDKLRMIVDPQSAYVQNGVAAMGRAMDAEIIPAFFGTCENRQVGRHLDDLPGRAADFRLLRRRGRGGPHDREAA
jgi:hypothetical protein